MDGWVQGRGVIRLWEEEGREHNERGHMFQDGRYYMVIVQITSISWPAGMEWSRVGHLQTCQLLQVMRQIIFTTMFQWCDYKHIPFPVSRGGLRWFPSRKLHCRNCCHIARVYGKLMKFPIAFASRLKYLCFASKRMIQRWTKGPNLKE